GIALLVVEHGQSRDRFFGIRGQLDRSPFLVLGLLALVVSLIQTAEHYMVVGAFGIQFNDLLVLLNREFQHIIGTVAALHVPERAQIDVTEQPVRFQIIGVALENFLGFRNRVANATG